MRRREKRGYLGLVFALLVLVADQASKAALLATMRPPGVTATPFMGAAPIPVLPILDLVLTWNRGISFGVGNDTSSWHGVAFALLAVVVALVLVAWMLRTSRALLALALGLIVGGAVGNLVDRLRYGAVVDFLYVHVGGFDWWPAFNVADSAITVGAAVLLIDGLFGARE